MKFLHVLCLQAFVPSMLSTCLCPRQKEEKAKKQCSVVNFAVQCFGGHIRTLTQANPEWRSERKSAGDHLVATFSLQCIATNVSSALACKA
jgi:hypothetical protein